MAVTGAKKIPLVSYTRGEEVLNCITHAAGLILSAAICVSCVKPAALSYDALRIICSVLYLIGTSAMFLTSALYHGFRPGGAKRILRLLDHCMIFFAVAGTATGCLPAVFDTVGLVPCVLMLVSGWGGAALGLVFTLRDFDGTRGLRLATYIVTAIVCSVCGCGAFGHLPRSAFYALLGGSALLLTGAALYGVGKKRRYFHAVFHLFVDAGLAVYFLGISRFCY